MGRLSLPFNAHQRSSTSAASDGTSTVAAIGRFRDRRIGPQFEALQVEVVQRYSKQPHLLQTLGKAWAVANKPAGRRPVAAVPPLPNKISQRLSADDVASIVAAYQAGGTSTGLAKQYNIGKATVLRLLEEAGVQRRRQSLTDEQVRMAIYLYRLGWSLEQVAVKLGCDHGTVMRVLDRAGVPRRDTHGRPR